MRFSIANPTASLYNNRTQVLAALEFACLDLIGQKWGVPVYDMLGGKLRDRVPFASYLFFRYPNRDDGGGEVRTVEQLVAQARELKARHGFTAHKLKGGVFPPEYELECYRALADGAPGRQLPLRPQRRVVAPSRRSGSGSDRGPAQRLLRGPGLGPERDAARAREGADPAGDQHRRRRTSSSSPRTCSTRRST